MHLDLYAGNVLVEGSRVTALLDFGGVPVFGDPDFDALTVAVYLRGEMTETTEEPCICVVFTQFAGRAVWGPS